MDETRKVTNRESLSILISISILLCSCGIIQGAVTLSPSGVVPVCSGDQLELICTITGELLQWSFSVFRGNETAAIDFRRTITPTSVEMLQFTADSLVFNFSRISAHGSMPVTSTLVTSPVSKRLNGTVMNCENVDSGEVSSATIIIGERGALQDINVRKQVVEFKNVTVILEWDELNPLHSVNVSVIPETQVNISSSTARLTMAYNVTYNISVMVSHLCDQSSETIFSEAYFYPCSTSNLHPTTHSTTVAAIVAMCDSLKGQLDDSVVISSSDPAVEGTTVTFQCLVGSVSNGPVSSTCMENGEWEPAPYQVNCSDTVVKADSQDLEIVLGCSLGIIFGLAVIITITVIAGVLLKARFKVSTTVFYKRTAQHGGVDTNAKSNPVVIYDDVGNHNVKVTDVQTSRLVYADIGQTTFNQQKRLLPGIPDFDDTPTEYAKINHNASVKPLVAQNTVKDTHHDIPSVSLDNLLIQLRPQISAKWYQFGEAAGIKKEVLDNFSKNCAPNDCIIEMLDYWLRNSTIQPIWSDVAGILKLINHSQLASAIESVYATGKLPVVVDMDWVSQTTELAEIESPPPIPPKMNEIASFDAPQNGPAFGFNHSDNATMLNNGGDDHSVPVLPPKPKCGQMMTGAVPPRPPRF